MQVRIFRAQVNSSLQTVSSLKGFNVLMVVLDISNSPFVDEVLHLSYFINFHLCRILPITLFVDFFYRHTSRVMFLRNSGLFSGVMSSLAILAGMVEHCQICSERLVQQPFFGIGIREQKGVDI